jgi:hypothetical protein
MEIKEYLKSIMSKEGYELWIEPISEQTSEELEKPILVVPNVYFKSKISEILKAQNLSAVILEHNPQASNVTEQKSTEIKQSLSAKTLQMEKPYGKEKVATSDIINSKFFTYPITSSKLKYAATRIILNNEEYVVHRGKNTPDPDEEPIGQLDTTHLRILLAIIHIWQEQNCRFLEQNQALVDLSVTLREIAKKIGYNLGGKNIQWLQQKIEELSKYPITLERKSDGRANSFTFISKLTTQTEQNPHIKKH